MGIEMPALSAILARLADPEINLAAYGGVVFPLALIVEAPIIMLLAASTALSKDWASYLKLRRFMHFAGAVLTSLHLLVAFTPMYYWIVEGLLGVPAEIVEPARLGLRIMTPWTWSIAYRRFNQGMMIRFGHSDAVGVGTVIRLTANFSVLSVGYILKDIPGIAVGSGAVAVGVVCEAVYTGLRVQPVIKNELRKAPVVEPLTWRTFFDFYIPLALTSLLTLIWQPIGSAALSRMPNALESLAIWPVLSGLVFMFRSLGVAYNEVVVALLDEPDSYTSLRKFVGLLSGSISILFLILTATPLSSMWFSGVSGLSARLAEIADVAIWFALPLPALNVFQSWYQGAILHSRRTRGIPESVVIFLITVAAVLIAGIFWGAVTGIYVGMAGFSLATFTQTIWLWVRSQSVMKTIRQRGQVAAATPSVGALSD